MTLIALLRAAALAAIVATGATAGPPRKRPPPIRIIPIRGSLRQRRLPRPKDMPGQGQGAQPGQPGKMGMIQA